MQRNEFTNEAHKWCRIFWAKIWFTESKLKIIFDSCGHHIKWEGNTEFAFVQFSCICYQQLWPFEKWGRKRESIERWGQNKPCKRVDKMQWHTEEVYKYIKSERKKCSETPPAAWTHRSTIKGWFSLTWSRSNSISFMKK